MSLAYAVEEPPQRHSAVNSLDELVKKTAVVLDDEIEFANFFKSVLELKGYEVLVYTSVKEAKQALVNFNPSVAFVDLNLEDDSGLNYIKALREVSKGTAVIGMSGYDSSSADPIAQEFHEIVDASMLKPFKLREVPAIIEEAMAKADKRFNQVGTDNPYLNGDTPSPKTRSYLGRVIDGQLHDIKNRYGVVTGNVEVVEALINRNSTYQLLSDNHPYKQRMSGLVDTLHSFSDHLLGAELTRELNSEMSTKEMANIIYQDLDNEIGGMESAYQEFFGMVREPEFLRMLDEEEMSKLSSYLDRINIAFDRTRQEIQALEEYEGPGFNPELFYVPDLMQRIGVNLKSFVAGDFELSVSNFSSRHVSVDYDQLFNAFVNLAKNSAETPGEGKRIVEITAHDEYGSKYPRVIFGCHDNGDGFSDEALIKLGKERYSSKERGQGIGLGDLFATTEDLYGGQVVLANSDDTARLYGKSATEDFGTLPIREKGGSVLMYLPSEQDHISGVAEYAARAREENSADWLYGFAASVFRREITPEYRREQNELHGSQGQIRINEKPEIVNAMSDYVLRIITDDLVHPYDPSSESNWFRELVGEGMLARDSWMINDRLSELFEGRKPDDYLPTEFLSRIGSRIEKLGSAIEQLGTKAENYFPDANCIREAYGSDMGGLSSLATGIYFYTAGLQKREAA